MSVSAKFSVELSASQPLGLLDEFMLMLLNEESGYFYQVPGREMNCAVIGAALAELSLLLRIDTDMESLHLLDPTETGNPCLDMILKEIVDEPDRRTAQYWIEKLIHHAEPITDLTLDKLVGMGMLQHHDGDFWTLAAGKSYLADGGDGSETAGQFIRNRVGRSIFSDDIPDPRDIIIVCLIQTCGIFRYMFNLDEKAEERIRLICRMDLIGRSIADAVEQNISSTLFGTSPLSKKIPRVSLSRLLLSPHVRTGNLPALMTDLVQRYGPVFKLGAPFGEPDVFIAGPEVNRWANRHGRKHLTSRKYFTLFERVYGATGVMPSVDGTDHFRLRKALYPSYSRKRLEGRLDLVYRKARDYMADWKVGESYPSRKLCRHMMNAQISPLFLSVDSQDLLDDIVAFKERALSVYIVRIMPEFMLKTPGMKRKARAVEVLLERVRRSHTSAQRAGCPLDQADDLLSLQASDPVLMPESNLHFVLSAAMLASTYLGDAFSFALYCMASQPELYERIRSEADSLFSGGDPVGEDLGPANMDVTDRFISEVLRMYPIVPVSMRHVANACTIEGYELPVGARVNVAQTATHYMEEVFPDPLTFDIDRYLPPRNEHKSPGYAPYGLGPHMCLGSRWLNLHMAVNLLIIAHYFTLSVYPEDYKLSISPFPTLKPKNLRFRIAEQKRELPPPHLYLTITRLGYRILAVRTVIAGPAVFRSDFRLMGPPERSAGYRRVAGSD